MEMKILLAGRARGQAHSIEELFTTVSTAFESGIRCQTLSAPSRRANWRGILSNLKWSVSLAKADVVHCTGDVHYVLLGQFRSRTVLTIHDLRFIEESRGLRRWLLWLGWIALPVWRANAVTVISEFTRRRLLSLCRVNPSKVRVVPNCVGDDFLAHAKPWPTGMARALLVGTTPNKNLERVAEACRDLPLRLAILGHLDAQQKELMSRYGLDYREYRRLSRGEVVNLYQSCDLVVFASTYEGFGMPILEGQAVGRPVLTSNLSPMREVAGGGALKVDPYDVVEIRDGLMRLMDDAVLRQGLVAEGFRNVAAYSAQSVAAQYAEVYLEVLEA